MVNTTILAVFALEIASHQQIEPLICAAQFHVRFKGHGVVTLNQRVEQFMHGNRLLSFHAIGEIFTLQDPRDGNASRMNPSIGSDIQRLLKSITVLQDRES
jgi:hypothetical protein